MTQPTLPTVLTPIHAIAAVILATVLSAVLTPVVISLAHRWQMLDHPGGRRVHAHAVPRLGGVAVFFAASIVSIAVLATSDLPADRLRFLIGMFIAADLLFLIGLVDDVRGVRPRTKVIGQVIAAGIVIQAGLLPQSIIVAGSIDLHLGLVAIPLMVLWIVAVTNAYNLIDGLNGLASGVAIVACAGAAVVAAFAGRPIALVVVAALGGALIGFLPHNFPRARIFLGDSGSMSIGFLLACLLVYAPSRASDMAVPIALPLTAMVLPFLDTTLAVMRRWLRGNPLSGADSRHIHHQLLALGFGHARATVALWAFSAVVVGFGVLVAVASPRVVLAALMVGGMVMLAMMVYGASMLSYHELRVAANVMRTGFGRARRLISEEIEAVDVADAINRAGSLDEVDEILAKHAKQFGFLGMKLVRDANDRSHLRRRMRTPAVNSWRFEYELHPIGAEHDDYALNIWCEHSSSTKVYGAERVSRILAPALEMRLSAALHASGERAIPQLHVEPSAQQFVGLRSSGGTKSRGPSTGSGPRRVSESLPA